MPVVKRKRGWKVVVGGTQHSGWLPAGAAFPLPEPVREIELDIHIESGTDGYFLVYAATDGSIHGDTWHESQAEAESVALEELGIAASDWERGESDDAG